MYEIIPIYRLDRSICYYNIQESYSQEINAPLIDDDGSSRQWARFDECKEYRHELS